MAAFVVSGSALLVFWNYHAAFHTQLNLLQCVGEVRLVHQGVVSAGRSQRRLVSQVRQVCAGRPWCRLGNRLEVHVWGERDLPGVHAQDLLAAQLIGGAHRNHPVEAAGSGQRGV